MSRFFTPLVQRRTYVETADLVFDLAVGIWWFTIFTTLLATGVSLLFALAGLPILAGTFYLARAAAAVERIDTWHEIIRGAAHPDRRPRNSAISHPGGRVDPIASAVRERSAGHEGQQVGACDVPDHGESGYGFRSSRTCPCRDVGSAARPPDATHRPSRYGECPQGDRQARCR
jgi:hypothetical protein